MRRLLAKGAFALGMGLLSACMSEGQPWGELSLQGALTWSPTPGRLDEGLLKTSRDYEVALEGLRLKGRFVLERTGDSNLSFDPSKPPPGYSLCHNGHCHAADGRLVSYEAIQAELGGAGSTDTWEVPWQAELTEFGEAVLTFATCEVEACEQDSRGTWGRGRLLVDSGTLHVRVWDARTPSRLTEDGALWELDLPQTGLVRTLELSFGPDEPLERHLALSVVLPDSFLDQADFASANGNELSEALATAWLSSGFQIEVK